jgi:8-oxo-dGTP pyrophosphatase MutT (NUDIX family)
VKGSLAIARAQVAAARGPDASRQQILAFLGAHPDALERSCIPGHLTGSAAVVDAAHERALVVLHRKLGRWLQPGGHADGDGDLARVALREAAEETGILRLAVEVPAVDLDVHEIPAIGGEPPHLHLDVRFVVVAPHDARATPNHESLALRWVDLAELDDPELALDGSTKRLLRVALGSSSQ